MRTISHYDKRVDSWQARGTDGLLKSTTPSHSSQPGSKKRESMAFQQDRLLCGEEKNRRMIGDASPCEPQETLISKRSIEFLKGFTQETIASVTETGAAFPPTLEGRGLCTINL